MKNRYLEELEALEAKANRARNIAITGAVVCALNMLFLLCLECAK